MKKITLIALALTVMFIAPHSFARTVKNDPVKVEQTTKIVKTHIATFDQVTPVLFSYEKGFYINQFKLSEAKRPPGLNLAKANYSRYKKNKTRDALIKKDNYLISIMPEPNSWRYC